jgi:UDP-N-acetylenolpyruvoylglucosamine reductase
MNDHDATFDDIRALMTRCQATVRERFGIDLEPEVKVIE